MSVFGARLKAARAAREMSQERVGVLAGIEEATARSRISHYENGRTIPDLATAKNIARALNVPTAYLYADTQEEADLLLAYHRANAGHRKQLLEFASKLSPAR